jgi:hypothetical protein
MYPFTSEELQNIFEQIDKMLLNNGDDDLDSFPLDMSDSDYLDYIEACEFGY